MSTHARIVVLLSAVLGGCELTAELGAYSLGEASGTSMESGNATTETGDESGTAGGTETGDGNPGDGDGDGDDLCMIDSDDDACRTCSKFLCCEALESCNRESGCNCMVECLSRQDPVICATTCTPGPAYFQLLQCEVTNCMAVCG